MLKLIEPANCIRLMKLSALYQLKVLQRNASRMVKSEFKHVAFVDEFKELSCTELIELIKNDDVNVDDEDVVFEAVLGWTRHDLEHRKECLEMILAHVRLPYCSRNYLRFIGDKEDMLTAKCFKYIHEAMAFQADTVHQHEMSSCRTLPRKNFRTKSCLVVVGGLTTDQGKEVSYNLCHYYDEDKGRWELMTELPPSVVGDIQCMWRGRRSAADWRHQWGRDGQMLALQHGNEEVGDDATTCHSTVLPSHCLAW